MPESTANPPGFLPPGVRPRLGHLAAMLRRARATLRYVDYAAAEQGCEQLAHDLLGVYSRQDLAGFGFLAIPRGGIIVLGMLSYFLDLRPSQFPPRLDASAPLVIVDDCSLSGYRFAQFLGQTPSPHVVFAHLYSHPDLRQAICDREPRVKQAVAAHDLVDHAPDEHKSEYKAWRERWRERTGPERYWLGQPDLVGFPWSEPDHAFFNPVADRVESGWRFFPPHRCLKNWTELGLPPSTARVRAWKVPDQVVSGQFDGVFYLCNAGTEEVYALQDVAAAMWSALAGYGEYDSVVAYVQSRYSVEEATLQQDLPGFVQELLARGLLEPVV